MFNELDRLNETAERLRQHAEQSEERDDDHHRNVPTPDPACLYGLVGEIARAGAADNEANPYAIALNAMIYVGCAIGRGPFMAIGNTFHHARLFGLHVGRSGRGRKGDAMSLLLRIDTALRARDEHLRPAVHRGGLSSREGLVYLIHDGEVGKDGEQVTPPVLDKRLLVIETEFANVLHQTARSGNTLSAALRDCWDGVTIAPATKTARIAATDPHVAMTAAVTPSELLALIEEKELSNGFANRFITVYSERERLVAFPLPTPQEEVDRLADHLADVLRFAQADRWAERDVMRVGMSADAAKVYAGLYEDELNRDTYGARVNALLERRAPTLLRMAMIFALTDKSTVIEVHHVRAALAWVRYWVDSVRFIFRTAAQEAEQAEVGDAAARIAQYLREHGRRSRTQISRECFRGGMSRTRIDQALDELLGQTPPAITVEIEARKTGPGSATKFYALTNSPKSAKSRNVSTGAAFGTIRGFEQRPNSANCGPDEATEGATTIREFEEFEISESAANPHESSRFESSHNSDDSTRDSDRMEAF